MQHLTTELRDLIEQYAVHFLLYSEEDLSYKAAPDRWSKKEIIGHLCDSAQNNLQRFIRGQYYAEPPHIVYHQDEWVDLAQYQQYDVKQLVNLWAALNLHLAWVLDHMAIDNYGKMVDTGKYSAEPHTLEWLAADYVNHLQHHLRQITEGGDGVIG
ncbi:MAG: DinB family protein [Saprospiraceae bacterium]